MAVTNRFASIIFAKRTFLVRYCILLTKLGGEMLTFPND
jgi:hypothetical protein